MATITMRAERIAKWKNEWEQRSADLIHRIARDSKRTKSSMFSLVSNRRGVDVKEGDVWDEIPYIGCIWHYKLEGRSAISKDLEGMYWSLESRAYGWLSGWMSNKCRNHACVMMPLFLCSPIQLECWSTTKVLLSLHYEPCPPKHTMDAYGS